MKLEVIPNICCAYSVVIQVCYIKASQIKDIQTKRHAFRILESDTCSILTILMEEVGSANFHRPHDVPTCSVSFEIAYPLHSKKQDITFHSSKSKQTVWEE